MNFRDIKEKVMALSQHLGSKENHWPSCRT